MTHQDYSGVESLVKCRGFGDRRILKYIWMLEQTERVGVEVGVNGVVGGFCEMSDSGTICDCEYMGAIASPENKQCIIGGSGLFGV